ncbi:hypothetical protein SC206_11780 [Rouxiella sp. T17]|uniref:hypothetical protein n=1 Tax=Rouxiella sp. T17 TaxID=3085684 RepID=UPI002FC72EED
MKKLVKLSVIAITTCSAFYGANALATHNNTALPTYSAEIAAKEANALPIADAGKDQTKLKINGWPGNKNLLDGSLSKNAVSYHWEVLHSTVPMELASGGEGPIKTGKSMNGKTVFAQVKKGINPPSVSQQNEAIFKLSVTNKEGKTSSSQVKMIFAAATANIEGSRVITQGKPLNVSLKSNITGNVKYIWEIYAKDANHSLVQYVSTTPEFTFDTARIAAGEYQLYGNIMRGVGKDFVAVKKIEKLTILKRNVESI